MAEFLVRRTAHVDYDKNPGLDCAGAIVEVYPDGKCVEPPAPASKFYIIKVPGIAARDVMYCKQPELQLVNRTERIKKTIYAEIVNRSVPVQVNDSVVQSNPLGLGFIGTPSIIQDCGDEYLVSGQVSDIKIKRRWLVNFANLSGQKQAELDRCYWITLTITEFSACLYDRRLGKIGWRA